MKKIVITGEKGGTGKSTITALLAEYLNFRTKKVQLIDTDPLQITTSYLNNCAEEGRIVSCQSGEYQIVDTAGVLGASLLHIQTAQIIIVPFRPHYADLLVIIPWFTTLKKEIQKKVLFLPNFWRNTKEQREGLAKLEQTTKEERNGMVLPPLPDKPAQYGTILNGTVTNFFASYQKQTKEIKEIMNLVMKRLESER